jgi:3-hydroxybutyryl-CoA dehydratase
MTAGDSVLGIQVGDTVEFTRTVTSDDIVAFANVTGDTNPLHLDDAYAAKTRFKRRIAHGMLSAGFISAALGTRLAPHACVVYLSQTLRFQRPVYIGDTVTARVEVTKIDPSRRFVALTTTCANQNGEDLLTGEALVLLDPVE